VTGAVFEPIAFGIGTSGASEVLVVEVGLLDCQFARADTDTPNAAIKASDTVALENRNLRSFIQAPLTKKIRRHCYSNLI